MLGEPEVVFVIKGDAGVVGGAGVDFQDDDGAGVAVADAGGEVAVGREVDEAACHGVEAVAEDERDVAAGGAVVEDLGRDSGNRERFDREGVTVAGADAVAVNLVALFFAFGDQIVEVFAGEAGFLLLE